MGRPRKHPLPQPVNTTETATVTPTPATAPPKRPKRKPLDERRNKLTFEDRDPNYVYRVFNDVGGRLKEAEEIGYEYVRSPAGLGDKTVDGATHLGSVVTKHVGNDTTGVLMRIPREWYEEDRAAKHRLVDESEADLKRHAEAEGRYGSVTIGRKQR
jgi:hypothetical protein